MSYYRRSLVQDEHMHSYKSVSESRSTLKTIEPRAPVILQRSPSMTSIISVKSRLARPQSFRHTPIRNDKDNVINIKIETENDCCFDTAQKNNYKYEYNLNESFEATRKNLSVPQSRSFSRITTVQKTPIQNINGGSATYYFDSDENGRNVTYVKHSENDTGLSLAGCLVKASPTFLPVNRSLELGAIFNGSTFGLLSIIIYIILFIFIYYH